MKSLVSSGDLIQIRGHRFGLPEKMDLYVGRLQVHSSGYGFVAPERPLEMGGEIYISGTHLNEAMNTIPGELRAPAGATRSIGCSACGVRPL